MQRCSQSIKKKLNTLKQDRLSEKVDLFSKWYRKAKICA